jgi:hypothetical protein
MRRLPHLSASANGEGRAAGTAVLSACRRLRRRGGLMAFFTIVVAPDLSPQDRRRAVRAGRPTVLSRSDHHTKLRAAGLTVDQETDVTAEFLTTLRVWFRESARIDELKAAQGVQAFEDRPRDRLHCTAAVEAGALRRYLFGPPRLSQIQAAAGAALAEGPRDSPKNLGVLRR